jgi:regulator of replication initiation timing
MTISNTLADQIGQLDAQIKVLTKQLETLKAQAQSSGLDEIVGNIFVVTVGKSVRASLDTASVKKELGQQWYDDHCKLAEVTTVRIKPRAEALANLS